MYLLVSEWIRTNYVDISLKQLLQLTEVMRHFHCKKKPENVALTPNYLLDMRFYCGKIRKDIFMGRANEFVYLDLLFTGRT